HPTDLPSFPTRRSSDLLSRRRTIRVSACRRDEVSITKAGLRAGHSLRIRSASAKTVADLEDRSAPCQRAKAKDCWQPLGAKQRPDRKSTRLNSSHLVIS